MKKFLNAVYIVGFSALLQGCLGSLFSDPFDTCMDKCIEKAQNSQDLKRCAGKCHDRNPPLTVYGTPFPVYGSPPTSPWIMFSKNNKIFNKIK